MNSINKLIALVCKFWILIIPYSIFTGILIFIVWIISLISIGLSVFAFIILIVFWCVVVAYTFTDINDGIWRELYFFSREHNWNKNIQTFLNFLWEN